MKWFKRKKQTEEYYYKAIKKEIRRVKQSIRDEVMCLTDKDLTDVNRFEVRICIRMFQGELFALESILKGSPYYEFDFERLEE